MSRGTLESGRKFSRFVYRTVTLYGSSFQMYSTTIPLFLTPVLNPVKVASYGLGSSRFARRYSGNRSFFLFLQVLRCFSSLRLPRSRVTAISCRVPPFGYLRIKAYLQLPEAFRCSSRPSSAPSAKAFTVRPYLLNHSILLRYLV